jgi:hypothetical protein
MWRLALLGLALFTFSVVALSGPGRIDIVDGQTRYEVARSLVEHGDSVIRDERVWFNVFPGRDGARYTYYRFPQSLAGAAAIWLADATGPVTESRRHFFFLFTSAAACALLAVLYAGWFRALGQSPLSACLWAAAGIFCTPNWFYGTSTFDEILGSAAVVAALVVAYRTRATWPTAGALVTGLLVGLAYNCKQPLGAFVFGAMALHDRRDDLWSARRGRMLLIAAGVAIGVLVEQSYHWWKFPLSTRAAHAELLRQYVPIWPDRLLPHMAIALICLAASPATGVFWYFPPLLVSCYGLTVWSRKEPSSARGMLASVAVIVLFTVSMLFFKGDPSWGPRYLTPVFAALWLFAPAGAAYLRTRVVALLLVLGLVVQILALSVDPHRLYLKNDLPSSFGAIDPWSYFRPAYSHLPNRPYEIMEIIQSSQRAKTFTPSPAPTFAFPVIDIIYRTCRGPQAVERYHVLNSLRPWWISQQYLPVEERPVDLYGTAALLLGIGVAGILLCLTSFSGEGRLVRHGSDCERL